jgi:hypothetical protein
MKFTIKEWWENNRDSKSEEGWSRKTTYGDQSGGKFAALEKKDVDCLLPDPQANCTSGIGIDARQIKCTVYDCRIDGRVLLMLCLVAA